MSTGLIPCKAPGCPEKTNRGVFCRGHWSRLPSYIKEYFGKKNPQLTAQGVELALEYLKNNPSVAS